MATLAPRYAPPPAVRRGVTLMTAWLGYLTFHIIAFPKGGVKIFGVPLTIGYIVSAALLLTALARGRGVALPVDRLIAFVACALLAAWSVLVMAVNGSESTQFTLAYFVTTLYLPLFGLTFFSSLTLDEHGALIERAFLFAVRFIVVYGIFLFLFRQGTGRWIEIPYLTVNSADLGQLDDKFINRGGIFKLISTYNNGNIFGVSLAIMAPLYIRLEPRRLLVWAMYLAMFLTLSRTVWLGAIAVMALSNLSRGVRPLTILYLMVGLVLAGVVLSGLLGVLGRDLSFLFDRNLGGRAVQLNALLDPHIIPAGRAEMLPEIAYLGMLESFGVPGLLLFLGHLAVVPLLLRLEGVPLLSPHRASACLQGLLVYMFVAASDAAFVLIPTMMIFWIIAGWGLWYAHRQVRGVRG